jgi:predicted outer membrane protein
MKTLVCMMFTAGFAWNAVAADRAALTPAAFVDQVSQNALMDVALSELAIEKSQSVAVLAFANRMLDRESDDAQIRAIASAHGLSPPLELDGNRLAILHALDTEVGSSFDYVYAKRMQLGHSRALELYRDAAKSPDAGVAQFARTGLPAVKENRALAKRLAGQAR